jgi:drug/metabolite transporter (DMT)-like permease
MPPLTAVLGRVGLAALALNLMLRAAGYRMPSSARIWGAFFAMGLLNNLIPFSLIFWGQTEIASGLASILNATTPLFTAVFAHFMTRDERMTPNRLLGVLLGLVGVTVMIGPAVALAGLGVNVVAQLAVLGAAISYALAGIFGRRFEAMGVPPMVTATGQVTASTVMLLPVALATDRPWALPAPSAETWTALVGLALLCTAVAYIIYFRILATAGATNLLLVTFLIPASAILLGMLVLDERLHPSQFAGMALIGFGLGAIDGRIIVWLKTWTRRRRADGAPRATFRERTGASRSRPRSRVCRRAVGPDPRTPPPCGAPPR